MSNPCRKLNQIVDDLQVAHLRFVQAVSDELHIDDIPPERRGYVEPDGSIAAVWQAADETMNQILRWMEAGEEDTNDWIERLEKRALIQSRDKLRTHFGSPSLKGPAA